MGGGGEGALFVTISSAGRPVIEAASFAERGKERGQGREPKRGWVG